MSSIDGVIPFPGTSIDVLNKGKGIVLQGLMLGIELRIWFRIGLMDFILKKSQRVVDIVRHARLYDRVLSWIGVSGSPVLMEIDSAVHGR